MTVLRLHGVGVAHAASAPLFDSVDLTLSSGLHGLVGANGAGKTTLLSVLAGELAPLAGTIARTLPDGTLVLCRQEVDRCEDDVVVLARRDDGHAAGLRGRLRLEPSALTRWATLSPGERKRWQIAAALAREPDVLLLDEPTNHLDAEGRACVVDALRRFPGLGIVVSHDRALLDALTSATLRIHQRALTLWPGPYSRARPLWERARAAEVEAHARARARVREVEGALDAARRRQAAADRSTSARVRMKDRNDRDARGIGASTRAGWAASQAGRVVATARDELARARRDVPTIARDPTLGARVFATFVRAPRQVLFHLERPRLARGGHVVLRDVRVTVHREDRVRIAGPNGAGKTTLLEAMTGSIAQPERILHLPQELAPTEPSRALARLRAAGPQARAPVLAIFAALGSDPERLLRATDAPLSPGEARKLVIAEALARQVWALVLDEPTNHMDLPSLERLEAALASYPGAIVLVTHDDTFAARVTTRTLHVTGGTVR